MFYLQDPSLLAFQRRFQEEVQLVLAGGPALFYERIVLETFHPQGTLYAATNTSITLYDSSGTQLDYVNIPAAFETLDYTAGLDSGTYYVKVFSPNTNMGPYALRALQLDPDDLLVDHPPLIIGSVSDDTAYEPDDDDPWGGAAPDPVPLSLGGVCNRNLESDTDIDWLVLTLP